jgi:hypothetical protein
MAHQQFQGVTAKTVAPFSFDCEVIVKLTLGMDLICHPFWGQRDEMNFAGIRTGRKPRANNSLVRGKGRSLAIFNLSP